MLINAAPRSYTSNIVADADLNLEGYNVTANALYSKDNYLLTMLDYGEAFPTDVKEGDKLFAWGEDSTKSYIYTYKQGAWDAGVKPQHMQDYYIADENRTVRFFCVSPGSVDDYLDLKTCYVDTYVQGLIFDSNTYLVGSVGCYLAVDGSYVILRLFRLYNVSCSTDSARFVSVLSDYREVTKSEGAIRINVNILSAVNSFRLLCRLSECDGRCYFGLSYVPDV